MGFAGLVVDIRELGVPLWKGGRCGNPAGFRLMGWCC